MSWLRWYYRLVLFCVLWYYYLAVYLKNRHTFE